MLRHISDAIARLTETLEGGIHVTGTESRVDAIEGRISELEGVLHVRVASAEADLLKATTERKNARNAEERTREKLEKIERAAPNTGEIDPESLAGLPAAYTDFVRNLNAGGGGEETVPPLREDMEPPRRMSAKESAIQFRINQANGAA